MASIPTVSPERHIVDLVEGMTRGSRIRATSGRGPATVEGWLQKQGATWHYFRDGKSLCRLHDQGPHHLRPFLSGGAKPNACHLCERALAQRPTIQQRDAVVRALIVDAPPPSQKPFQVYRAAARSTNFSPVGFEHSTLELAKAHADRLSKGEPISVVHCVFEGELPAGRPWDVKEAALYHVRGDRTAKDYAQRHQEALKQRLTPPTPEPRLEPQPIPPAAPESPRLEPQPLPTAPTPTPAPTRRDAGSPRFVTRDSVAASLDLLIEQEVRAARAKDRARIEELEADVAALRKQLAGVRAALGAA